MPTKFTIKNDKSSDHAVAVTLKGTSGGNVNPGAESPTISVEDTDKAEVTVKAGAVLPETVTSIGWTVTSAAAPPPATQAASDKSTTRHS
jgi:hypothetical protein